jgi:hypothetical protein
MFLAPHGGRPFDPRPPSRGRLERPRAGRAPFMRRYGGRKGEACTLPIEEWKEPSVRGFPVNSTLTVGAVVRRRAVGRTDESHNTSQIKREFDPGSGSTLAACLTHASRTPPSGGVADG